MKGHGALVMGLHLNGTGILQTMAAHGVPVAGIDHRRGQPGFWTRYGRTLVCPDPARDPRALLAFLVELAGRLGWGAVLFPTSDEFVVFVARHREALAPAFDVTVPPAEVVDAVIDKWRFHRLAQRHGIPAPATFRPASLDEVRGLRSELRFPCLVKPVVTASWKGTGRERAVLVPTAGELEAIWTRVSSVPGEVIVQERIPGGDDRLEFYFACYDRASRPLGEFTARKIRQYPAGVGSTCLAESARCPDLTAWSRRLLGALGYQGLVDVEFKRDPRDGALKVIEVNPRLGLQHRLARRTGVDLAFAAFCDAIGRTADVPAPRDTVPGVKWLVVSRDLERAHEELARGTLSVPGWLHSVRGPKVDATWDWRDPGPFVRSLRRRTLVAAAGIAAHVVRWIATAVVARVGQAATAGAWRSR